MMSNFLIVSGSFFPAGYMKVASIPVLLNFETNCMVVLYVSKIFSVIVDIAERIAITTSFRFNSSNFCSLVFNSFR
ncbi:MAG: hypothetical protein EU541_06295 [Promethearchaeota archaeon]|nr:MAG: hypothetical protein EU541_06295 [Candidatus Lokiarchaeota archaeon]